MWELDDRTRYSSGSNWIRDKHGTHTWLVAVRAAFHIESSGHLRLMSDQLNPVLEPIYRGDPAETALVLDSDLLWLKPTTDVVLDACAYAPNGRPVRAVETRLQIGSVDKRVIVHGPRQYHNTLSGLAVTVSERFVTAPIHYEWAFGGSDVRDPDPKNWRVHEYNPVGKGVCVKPSDLDGCPAHCIEHSRNSSTERYPAGYGAIASSWQPRRALAGTYDSVWSESRKPLLPQDYDVRFALSAPEDQRPPLWLKGGEAVVIENMTPESLLQFKLPRIEVRFRTFIQNDEPVRHVGHLSSVFITPHENTVSMCWQSGLPLRSDRVEYLDHTEVKAVRVK